MERDHRRKIYIPGDLLSDYRLQNNQRTRHLSFEEEDRLLAVLTGAWEYLRPLITVAIYAGPRRGELLKLRWANVDFHLNSGNFTETKTNKDRFCANGANRSASTFGTLRE
jgi:integrase